MEKTEVARRVRALLAQPEGERFISIHRLARLANLHPDTIYEVAKTRTMSDRTQENLGRALAWVENDQVIARRRGNKKDEITIRDPQPPQKLVSVVVIRPGHRPEVRYVAQNPRTFPNFRE
jgi:hypothetical protein